MRSRLILAGSAAYLALIFGVMLWRGISIEPEWVVLALLLVAIALGRGRSFIVDWLPFLVLFLAYEEMRGFAAKTGFAPHDLSGLERLVFGGAIPTLVLQHAFYHPGVVSWQDVVAMFFYFMHFPLPIVVGFYFWVNSREHFRRFVAALLLMSFLAFATYLFYPSAPPWYQFPGQVVKINNETVQALWQGKYFVSEIYNSFNPNKFAAFPSLHAAFPTLAAAYAWSRYRALAIGLIAWSAAVMLSIVYLGEHYVVDALDGFIYVAVAMVIVELVARRLARRGSTPARPSA
ncbi:MAG TPA: phosphatase PAP2 family protein [Candidatus Acidoferrum sp.]|nr:phosphatase PAP2 family protein [Candidatus Acidoferrum sp.]